MPAARMPGTLQGRKGADTERQTKRARLQSFVPFIYPSMLLTGTNSPTETPAAYGGVP